MSPLPELNLNLGIAKDPHSTLHSKDDGEIIVRTDSGLRKYSIKMIISDEEIGKIKLKTGNKEIEIPTYKLTVTDDKTNEIKAYQIMRDTLQFVKSTTKKSFLSFLGIKRFDKTSFLYENISFEPDFEKVENFNLSKYRSLSDNSLSYKLSGNGENIMLYAGKIDDFKKPEDVSKYFMIVDQNNGMSFIGDILYREKLVKLTPKVELQIIKRKNIPKNFEFDEKGKAYKIIYL